MIIDANEEETKIEVYKPEKAVQIFSWHQKFVWVAKLKKLKETSIKCWEIFKNLDLC